MSRRDEPLAPTRRDALLIAAAAASASCAADPPAPPDATDLGATDVSADVSAADAMDVTDATDVSDAMDAVDARDARARDAADVSRADRGAPCGIELPFRGSLFLDDLPEEGARVDYELYVVVARDARGVYAYSAVCPHQGCAVSVDEGATTVCSCHWSTFDADGTYVEGPARRSLPNHPVRICEGRVLVDRGHVVAAGTRVTP